MTYQAFAADVLAHGADFACGYAATMGTPGRTLAVWLARLTLRPTN